MRGERGWGFIVMWAVVMIGLLLLSKVIIEAVLESDMPLWLKIMLLK